MTLDVYHAIQSSVLLSQWDILGTVHHVLLILFSAQMRSVPCSIIDQCTSCNSGPVCLTCTNGYVLDLSTSILIILN
jgi:hypothetical protein